ncbi:MAG: HK97 family phage prohead protease, partial [Synergistaceae bacterium]|nr:HK97 family phage prohead protease [Synergistaceae bacterium]
VYENIREDDIGLWIEGRLLLDLEKGKEAYILLKNQAIRGLSIGYMPLAWEWENRDSRRIRVLKEIDLWEVSLVTFPANPKALIDDVKSIKTIRDVEDTLRDAGFSRTEAKALISACKSAQRDAEDENEEIKAAEKLLNLMKGRI